MIITHPEKCCNNSPTPNVNPSTTSPPKPASRRKDQIKAKKVEYTAVATNAPPSEGLVMINARPATIPWEIPNQTQDNEAMTGYATPDEANTNANTEDLLMSKMIDEAFYYLARKFGQITPHADKHLRQDIHAKAT
jgi:hypothetical protein